MTYARDTSVPVERSRGEVERLIVTYGGDRFVYGNPADGLVVIGFRMAKRMIRVELPLPAPAEQRKTPTGKPRRNEAAERAHAQAVRSRWRSLLLIVKAKLEAVESGVATFETEWLPYFVLPGTNETVAQRALPMIDKAYETGKTPALLLGMDAS